MNDPTTVGLWQTLRFRDPERMITWLRAIGFTEHAIYRTDVEPPEVAHAEMLWPAGGGIMFGVDRDSPDWPAQPGTSAAYLVTDDPDGAYAAALAAGGASLYEPRDQDYGGRGAAVVDPEGNLWSFGSYRP